MRRIACCVCNRTTALWHDYERRCMNELHFSERLEEYVHPSCLSAQLNGIEKHYGIPMEPLRRLLNFGAIKESADDQ